MVKADAVLLHRFHEIIWHAECKSKEKTVVRTGSKQEKMQNNPQVFLRETPWFFPRAIVSGRQMGRLENDCEIT
jgi:hypothetical protein